MASCRSGFVGLLGQSNVGKSTFLNRVMGKKLLITSAKPQTTRNRVRCIYNAGEGQIVFVDSPGLHRPFDRLGKHIVREAYRALREIDLLLYMVQPWGEIHGYDQEVFGRVVRADVPSFLLVNKADQAKGNALEETLLAYEATGLFDELFPLSALRGWNVDDVLHTVWEYLPARDPLFSQDREVDHPEEFLISEMVREQVFRETHQEIPYSTAVQTRHMGENEDGVLEIRVDLLVNRDSQKGILIGKNGEKIRTIGTRARSSIERLLATHVFLDLRVKVAKDWRKDEAQIRQLTGEDA